ncbi:hypothetical protein DIPPA_32528 [Diplonema papillatum]|nr:hypothetical protein DIPPA_32528 [Diplonema papillatum]
MLRYATHLLNSVVVLWAAHAALRGPRRQRVLKVAAVLVLLLHTLDLVLLWIRRKRHEMIRRVYQGFVVDSVPARYPFVAPHAVAESHQHARHEELAWVSCLRDSRYCTVYPTPLAAYKGESTSFPPVPPHFQFEAFCVEKVGDSSVIAEVFEGVTLFSYMRNLHGIGLVSTDKVIHAATQLLDWVAQKQNQRAHFVHAHPPPSTTAPHITVDTVCIVSEQPFLLKLTKEGTGGGTLASDTNGAAHCLFFLATGLLYNSGNAGALAKTSPPALIELVDDMLLPEPPIPSALRRHPVFDDWM